jgi:hypothetical protein
VQKKETSPFEKRHGECFGGKLTPFGALIDYYPTPKRPDRKNKPSEESSSGELQDDDNHGRPKMGPKGVPGIFLGYMFEPGGKWKAGKGKYVIADFSELKKGKARPNVQIVQSVFVASDEPFIFPMAELHDFIKRSAIGDQLLKLNDKAHVSDEGEEQTNTDKP